MGALSTQPGKAVDLDLNGVDITLPAPGSFGNQLFLNGVDDVTNSGADATLSEGGGPVGTIYSGVISDGAGTIALIHTGGDVTFTGNNSYTGGTTIRAARCSSATAASAVRSPARSSTIPCSP